MWPLGFGGLVDVLIGSLQRCTAGAECPSSTLSCPLRPSLTCPAPGSVSSPACPALVCAALAAEAAQPGQEEPGEPVASWPACAPCERPADPETCNSSSTYLPGLLVAGAGGWLLALVVVNLVIMEWGWLRCVWGDVVHQSRASGLVALSAPE